MSQGRYEGSIPQAGQVCGTTSCACDRSGVEMLTAVEKCGAGRVKRGGPKLRRAVSANGLTSGLFEPVQVVSYGNVGLPDVTLEHIAEEGDKH